MSPFLLRSTLFVVLVGCAAPAELDSTDEALTHACATPIAKEPLGALAPLMSDVNTACSGRFCSMTRIDAFATTCTATIDQVASAVNVTTAFEDQWLDAPVGSTFGRDDLLKKNYFASYAPGLLEKIDAWAGSKNVIAYELVNELPCPNCHEFWVRYVLFYPDTRKVVAIDGQYGYDS
jgi:hypothetical protein